LTEYKAQCSNDKNFVGEMDVYLANILDISFQYFGAKIMNLEWRRLIA
jgi:hypothetical protein